MYATSLRKKLFILITIYNIIIVYTRIYITTTKHLSLSLSVNKLFLKKSKNGLICCDNPRPYCAKRSSEFAALNNCLSRISKTPKIEIAKNVQIKGGSRLPYSELHRFERKTCCLETLF